MTHQHTRPDQGDAQPDPTLWGLVSERVAEAYRIHERRASAVSPRLRRRGRPPRIEASALNADPHALQLHALKSVFRQFGEIHRLHRERTHERTGSGLRAAATAFKQEPSLFTLVAVAGFLDDLALLRP